MPGLELNIVCFSLPVLELQACSACPGSYLFSSGKKQKTHTKEGEKERVRERECVSVFPNKLSSTNKLNYRTTPLSLTAIGRLGRKEYEFETSLDYMSSQRMGK